MFQSISRKMRQTEVSAEVLAIFTLAFLGIIMRTGSVVKHAYATGEMTVDKQIVSLLIVASCGIVILQFLIDLKDRHKIGKALNWT